MGEWDRKSLGSDYGGPNGVRFVCFFFVFLGGVGCVCVCVCVCVCEEEDWDEVGRGNWDG